MTQPKKKQISKTWGFIIITVFIGIFEFVLIYGASETRSMTSYIIAGVLAFVWIMMLSSVLLDKKFKRAIRKNREARAAMPDAQKTQSPVNPKVIADIERPPFQSVVYERSKPPVLSQKGEVIWASVRKRFDHFAYMIATSVFLAMVMNWGLIILYSNFFNMDEFSYGDHLKLTMFTVVATLILLVSKIRSAAAQGIPYILAIVWLVHPIAKGLGWLIKGDENRSQEAIFTFLGGSILIIFVWFILWRLLLKKFKNSIQDGPSAKLLFLWVFRTDAAQEMLSNFGYKWRILGPIFFLNGDGMMSIDQVNTTMKLIKGKKLLVQNENDLKEVESEKSDLPDKYGFYEMRSILCGDGIWKQALNNYVQHKDLVLMSLCNYTEKNRGCEYEIRKLIDEVPTEKIVLLINEHTDIAALAFDLKEFWNKMAPSSPNLRKDPHPITIYKITTPFMSELAEEDDRRGGEADTSKRFKTMKALSKEGDQIVRLLCEAASLEVVA